MKTKKLKYLVLFIYDFVKLLVIYLSYPIMEAWEDALMRMHFRLHPEDDLFNEKEKVTKE